MRSSQLSYYSDKDRKVFKIEAKYNKALQNILKSPDLPKEDA